jgi:hypothetical protein
MDLLKNALNEFSEREIPKERRDELTNELEKNIGEGLKGLLEQFSTEADKHLNQLTADDFKEFLIKRYQLGSRTVTSDLIDQLRKEGLSERIEEKLESVKAELAADKKDRGPEKSEIIGAFEQSLNEDNKEIQKVMASIDERYLANETEFKECNGLVLSLFKHLDDKLDSTVATV